MTYQTRVEIYQDFESEEFLVRAVGTDEFDDLATMCEQEAKDEAQAMADELGCSVVVL